MSQENLTADLKKRPDSWKVILVTGVLVGTLDGLAAVIQTLINGGSPVVVFQFIASGIFGEESFEGGMTMAVCGLIFHLCIALGWTTFFFLIYPKMKFLSQNKILAGLGYGLFIWLVMTRIVLPLSNVPQFPFRISQAIIGILILMAVIGLPLSFIASKFYSSHPGDEK